jgi:hypothetical protein
MTEYHERLQRIIEDVKQMAWDIPPNEVDMARVNAMLDQLRADSDYNNNVHSLTENSAFALTNLAAGIFWGVLVGGLAVTITQEWGISVVLVVSMALWIYAERRYRNAWRNDH